jgi:hypothetical protein
VLRIVETADSVVSFDEAAAHLGEREALHTEAAEIEATFGKNAYSDFLRQHGQRPEPNQAATLGILLGWRVRASDGSMQPRLTKAERDATRAARTKERHKAKYRRQVARLREALLSLAETVDSPADVIEYIDTRFDEPMIREHLHHAVEWLSRFAQEWGHRDNSANEKVPEPPEGDSTRREP